MKWKLKPDEIISYKTIMQEIDTANSKMITFGGMDDSTNATYKKMMIQLRNINQHTSTVTHMREQKKDIIDIEIVVNNENTKPDTAKPGSDLRNFQDLMGKMTKGVMLRGAIHEDGSIQSFYTKNDQKNLLALFFELPGRAVKTGDSWSLGISFIAMDQSFKCDSSYHRNRVSVINIVNQKDDKIITLKYDITEYVKGTFVSPFTSGDSAITMRFTYEGTAAFSLEKGRWIQFDGVMSNLSTGMMSAQTTQKLSLIPE